MTERQMKEKIGISLKRVAGHCRDGYLEKRDILNRKTRTTESVYCMTKKGREMCREQLGYSDFYRSNSATHDTQLAERYFRLSYENQCSWETESQIRDRMEEHINRLKDQGEKERVTQLEKAIENKGLSPPDGGYKNEAGQFIAVEVITRNYTDSEIEAKSEFSQELGFEYQPYQI